MCILFLKISEPKSLLDNCLEDVQCEVGLNATGLVACISYKCICAMDAYLVKGMCFKKRGDYKIKYFTFPLISVYTVLFYDLYLKKVECNKFWKRCNSMSY